MRPTMRLIRIPAPTKKADFAVLGVSTGASFAGPGIAAPTCRSVSPAIRLASFRGSFSASTISSFEGISAARLKESSIWLSEIVVFHLIEKSFVTNIQVFGSPTLVATIAIQGRLNLPAFDKTQRSLCDFGKRTRQIGLEQVFDLVRRVWAEAQVLRFEHH